MVTIRVKRLTKTARLPTKAHPDDAGWDLYSDASEPDEEVIASYDVGAIPTGIAIEIPDGYCGVIKGRSGLAAKGVTILGGVIDSGYRGEINVLACMSGIYTHHRVPRGDRIAQLLILPVPRTQIVEVDELPASERGSGGFGSTGK